MPNKITVSKLSNSYHAGDWHDRPLGWTVRGPGLEIQNFSTREHARAYADIRRHTDTAAKAQREYVWVKF